MSSSKNQSTPATGLEEAPPRELTRREAVQYLAALPFLAAYALPSADLERARTFVDNALRLAETGAFAPKFFTAAEYRTVRLLADMIIPRDERSGNASDAGVPEFMDFWMTDRPTNQQWMRDGLKWLDTESTTRFGKPFVGATVSQRESLLNDIAWPAKASASVANGVQFFNRFRDLTSSGFWTSRIGVKDLEYRGNTFVPKWDGCPPAALRKLGVTYDKFEDSRLRLTPPSSE
jgi:gluconate 2-dehydrogenase gamma chain